MERVCEVCVAVIGDGFQASSGFGDVASAIGQHAMDVFPFGLSEGGDRDLFFGLRDLNLGTNAGEGIQDVIGIRWLGQKVGGS